MLLEASFLIAYRPKSWEKLHFLQARHKEFGEQKLLQKHHPVTTKDILVSETDLVYATNPLWNLRCALHYCFLSCEETENFPGLESV